MNEVATQEFDYSPLSKKGATVLRTAAHGTRSDLDRSARGFLDAGEKLRKARDVFNAEIPLNLRRGQKTWSAWLATEIGISREFAAKLILVAEKFAKALGSRREHVPELSFKVMRALAPAWVTEEARQEVVDRAGDGEVITEDRAKEIARDHAFPTPSEARGQARETGIPVEASDGMVYTGATREEEQEQDDRRDLIFNVKRSIDDLAKLEVSAEEWLETARSWQLFSPEETENLSRAAEWLTELQQLWEQRNV